MGISFLSKNKGILMKQKRINTFFDIISNKNKKSGILILIFFVIFYLYYFYILNVRVIRRINFLFIFYNYFYLLFTI